MPEESGDRCSSRPRFNPYVIVRLGCYLYKIFYWNSDSIQRLTYISLVSGTEMLHNEFYFSLSFLTHIGYSEIYSETSFQGFL